MRKILIISFFIAFISSCVYAPTTAWKPKRPPMDQTKRHKNYKPDLETGPPREQKEYKPK